MTVSRGQFLKLCGGTLIAGHLDPASLLHAPAASAAQFRPHLGSTFVVGAGDRRIRVRLADVIERSHDPTLEQFSLQFHGVPGASLSEGTYRFRHPLLGQFELYVAPIGASTSRHPIFEVCFCRRR